MRNKILIKLFLKPKAIKLFNQNFPIHIAVIFYV